MRLNEYKFILVNRLCHGQLGILSINYHQYKKGKTYPPLYHKIMYDTCLNMSDKSINNAQHMPQTNT